MKNASEIPNSSCYLCGSSELKIRDGSVRDMKSLKILECSRCGLVFLSSFDHVKANFYTESGMHAAEDSLFQDWIKETAHDDERRARYVSSQIVNKSVLDFGCGTGGFLLKAREFAREIAGVEPEKANRKFFERSDLKVYENLNDVEGKFDVITLFHVLEHLPDPRSELTNMSKKLAKQGQIIIEVPNASDALLTLYQSKEFSNFTYWSCHLFLFTNETLAELCTQAGLSVKYIKQIQRYPLSNHLHWLAKGRAGGHKIWGFIDSPELSRQYEAQLSSIGLCDTIIAGISLDE